VFFPNESEQQEAMTANEQQIFIPAQFSERNIMHDRGFMSTIAHVTRQQEVSF
jgi:hypothetical protein